MALCERCHTFWHAHLKEKGLKLDSFSRELTVKGLRSMLAKLPRGEFRNNRKRNKAKRKEKFVVTHQRVIPPVDPPKYQIPPQYNDKFAILERVVFQQASDILTLKQRLTEIEALLKSR